MKDVYLVGYGGSYEKVLVFSDGVLPTEKGFRLDFYDVNSGEWNPMYYEDGKLTLTEKRYPVDYIDIVFFHQKPIDHFLKPFIDSVDWSKKLDFSDYKESYRRKGRPLS